MRSNCLVIALRQWIMARGRQMLAFRRSISFAGAIPHFAYIRIRGAELTVIDYVPSRIEPHFGKVSEHADKSSSHKER